MNKDIASKALNYLYNNAIYNINNNLMQKQDASVNITMFGGEPFLNINTIESIFEEALLLQNKHNIKFSSTTITNGTIINDRIIKMFQKYLEHFNLSIQVSVDGLKESHDFYRKYHDGRGSFDTIKKNIPLFKEIFGGEDFIDTHYRRNLHIHGSLNKNSIKTMYSSWKMFKYEWNIPGIWFMPIHSELWDDEDVKTYENELAKITSEILKEAIKKNNVENVNDYSPISKCIERLPQSMNKPCGAGDTYISFTANGDIYPCHQFYFNAKDDSKVGDVFNGIDNMAINLFKNYDAKDMQCEKIKCKNFFCYRCIADTYSRTGCILSSNVKERCNMSKIEDNFIKQSRKILIDKKLL